MRILVTSTPGTGHLLPIAPLAIALQARGHEVRWATAAGACEAVGRLGFRAHAAGLSPMERREAFPDFADVMALPPRARRPRLFAGMFATAAAPRMHADLGPVFDEFEPELVIHDLAELAAAPMAVARGIPHATVAFSGALVPAAIDLALERVTPVWMAEGLAPPTRFDDLVGGLYLHPFPAAFGQSVDHPAVAPMRPGVAPVSDAEPPAWAASLGVDRAAVYLTAGTEPPSAQAPWAAAFEALAALDVDAVATIGPFVDPTSFGTLPTNVRVERFVPQHHLLDRMSVVMSHGGAGTVLAAAARALPQLVVPQMADQWENADAVAGAGVGSIAELDQRSGPDLHAALSRLLADGAFRSAAARVAVEIAAMPEPATYAPTLEALVEP